MFPSHFLATPAAVKPRRAFVIGGDQGQHSTLNTQRSTSAACAFEGGVEGEGGQGEEGRGVGDEVVLTGEGVVVVGEDLGVGEGGVVEGDFVDQAGEGFDADGGVLADHGGAGGGEGDGAGFDGGEGEGAVVVEGFQAVGGVVGG